CVRSLPLFPDFSLGRSRAVRPRRIRRSGGSRLNLTPAPDAEPPHAGTIRADTRLQGRMRSDPTPGLPADRASYSSQAGYAADPCGAGAEVDYAYAPVWAAVVDADRRGAPVTAVMDGDHTAER